jgi:hypothetical protein
MVNTEKLAPENELLFRVIKIIDIAYIAILYFTVAYMFGRYINMLFTNLYGIDFESKSTNVLYLEVLSQVIFIAIFCYIGKNLVQLIPFPLDGVNRFDHSRVKELSSGAFLTIFIVMFQYTMQNKLSFIKEREDKTKKITK